ncbi:MULTISPECIES: IS200/IS605 family transposase [Acidiplasma]|jgi:putative transposase|uniref:Transposase n=2 Tax=Acidiplasma TaxID=507753 RepID=A0A0Q0RX13_9ARCH|nr:MULTISPECIES: IS200/IS605 family transposase [Acidiplasma]KQB33873.1 transposase [Acidiplasma aeolicum]KQB34448.1 transposase [Acidiplasma cupricumulans]
MEITQYKKEYKSYDHLVFSCQYHVIFTPKYRRKVLVNGIDERLKELIIEKENDYGYKIIEMEVMPDHVHLLIDLKPRIDVIRCVNLIKGYTSHVLRDEFPVLRRKIPTLWTRSKFIASVGAVTLEVVEKYIEDQKKV